jgi:hypothetical protein
VPAQRRPGRLPWVPAPRPEPDRDRQRAAPYDPERVWHPGTGIEGCPQDRDGLAEVTPSKPAKRGAAKVGGKDAVYREWRVGCVDAKTGKPEAGYTQRVWYLKASKILVVDEWSTPGLGEALATAKFG